MADVPDVLERLMYVCIMRKTDIYESADVLVLEGLYCWSFEFSKNVYITHLRLTRFPS